MKDEKQPQAHGATDLENAAWWIVRLQDPELSPEALYEWEQWIAASEQHRQAFDDLERLSTKTHEIKDKLADIPLPGIAELSRDSYAGTEPVSQWLGSAMNATHNIPADPNPERRNWRVYAMAAIIGGLALGLGIFGLPYASDRPGGNQLQAYETAESQHRKINLADGSVITMGGKSSLSVTLTGDLRAVVLESGEALFNVAKDQERPFVVIAGSGTITAIGTAFNVRHDSERVVVTVTEGKVEVTQTERTLAPGASSEEPSISSIDKSTATLIAGQSVAYNATGITTLETSDPSTATAWQDGRLQYRGEPLKYVIMGVNRYSSKEIVIVDKSVENLVFTGSVFQDQAADWLLGLEEVFPVEVVAVGDDAVLLKARAAQQ